MIPSFDILLTLTLEEGPVGSVYFTSDQQGIMIPVMDCTSGLRWGSRVQRDLQTSNMG